MHVHYKFGLFLIFLLSVSYCMPTNDTTQQNVDLEEYDYDDEYYDDDDQNNYSLHSKSSSTLRPSTASPSPGSKAFNTQNNHNETNFNSSDIDMKHILDEYESDDDLKTIRSSHDEKPKCPEICICQEDMQNITCSNGNLLNVPKNIPQTALKLDLSNNNIEEINVDDFQNIKNIREIVLNGNRIKTIPKETFTGLKDLVYLGLSNNRLTEIQADNFAYAENLNHLDLSNNSIVLPKDQIFLNQSKLKELYLRNCSLTEVYEETFKNLSSLTTLKLDNNDFNKKINTKAFEPLKNLLKLRLPELEVDIIKNLCNVLEAIDNISLKRFDISCYELVLNTSFTDSLSFNTETPPSSVNTKNFSNKVENANSNILDNAPIKTALINKDSNNNSMTSIISNSTLLEPSIKTNRSAYLDSDDDAFSHSNQTSTLTEETYQVAISQDAINYILIGIILFALIGILIGVICRRDIGGIKTKLCRTRRPLPTDQVRPAEEIPLNKVI